MIGARVRWKATVICGRAGCPWTVTVEAKDETRGADALEHALAHHELRHDG